MFTRNLTFLSQYYIALIYFNFKHVLSWWWIDSLFVCLFACMCACMYVY